MQLQQNVQQTRLQVTQTMMVFKLLKCYYQALLLMSVRKKQISSNEAYGLVDG